MMVYEYYDYAVGLLEFFQAVINVIVLPVMAGMLAWFDKRNERRGQSRDEFNLILLEGLEKIGKVAILTAHKQKGSEVNGQLDKAMQDYEAFEVRVVEFKNKSVKRAVRG